MSERLPHGLEPIGQEPDGTQFTNDIIQTSERLGIPPNEVMKLARSGKLLFRYTGDRYRTRESDITGYLREQERKREKGQDH